MPLIPSPLWHGVVVPVSIVFRSDIGLAVRVFANGPGDLGSIPGRVIPKTQKMVLDASLLNTQHYKVRIKGKVGQSREGVAPSPTPWCSSYRKGSLRVTLDYGRQLFLKLLVLYLGGWLVVWCWLVVEWLVAGWLVDFDGRLVGGDLLVSWMVLLVGSSKNIQSFTILKII